MDKYLLKYISEFLIKCNKCNKFNYLIKEQQCCICNNYFCSECDIKLIPVFSFYTSYYCNECFAYLFL